MARRACRTDANHAEIRDALRRLGCFVHDTADIGGGYPDLTVGCRGRWVLVEVKDPTQPPSKQRLTPDQEKFHAVAKALGLPIAVVRDLDEAVDAVFERQRRTT